MFSKYHPIGDSPKTIHRSFLTPLQGQNPGDDVSNANTDTEESELAGGISQLSVMATGLYVARQHICL
jgi:hypothetical protein